MENKVSAFWQVLYNAITSLLRVHRRIWPSPLLWQFLRIGYYFPGTRFLPHLLFYSSFIVKIPQLIRAKRVSNWYIPNKKSARVPACRVHVCTCAIILVLVCGIMYHIRTYLVSARYQPATKIRVCRYVCARVGYVLCATYVRKLVSARLFVPGISRLPRYVYVDTYVPVAEITWK